MGIGGHTGARRSTGFFMPVFGSAEIDGEVFGLDDLSAPVLPTSAEATTHKLMARTSGAKVAVFIGQPLHQPVVSNGPMAFANQDHLVAAAAAYQRGELGSL